MTTMPKGINWNEQFYKLLRLSLGLTQEFSVDVDADGWRRLYQTAIRQSLVGVCYQGVCLLPEGSKPPVEIAMQWASEAESIKGMNELLYQEAARLTSERSTTSAPQPTHEPVNIATTSSNKQNRPKP